MSDFNTEISDAETFYVVYDEAAGELASESGELDGWYNLNYHTFSHPIGEIAIGELENVRAFTNLDEANSVKDALEKEHKSLFSVITVKKKIITVYSMEWE